MTGEKISVIVAAYNQLKYLPRVMEAWNKQTFKDYKLYLVDDGSPDGTKAWAKENASKYNFKYFWQENKGMRLAKSINNALKVATGEYALFAMGDSIPMEDYLEQMSHWLNKNWGLVGVRENVSDDLSHISWDWRFDWREHDLDRDIIPIRAYETGKITGNGYLAPMWALKKIGGWPEGFVGYSSEDNYLTGLLVAEDVYFADMPKAVLRHIEHPIRVSDKKNQKLFDKGMLKIKKKMEKELRPRNICLNFDDFSPINNNLFFLRKLRQNYPNLKVSLFTVPATVQTGTIESFLKHPRFCDEIRKESDWLELLPHGWHHPDMEQESPEFQKMSYFDTTNYLKLVDELFKKIDLPYKKIFKPPQYRISEAAKDCFRDNGWTLALSGEGQYWPSDIKTVTWNWNIRHPLPLRKDIISYGHISDIGNGLVECWPRLLEMPSDTNFKFLSEVKDKGIGVPKRA
jgi:glycosyltransferase involved in cell wall biosynthesis